MQITEQYIIEQAPNPNAVKNGKALCDKGSLINLSKTADDSLYFAQCKSSGKALYQTSVDFIDSNAIICRCSCPSRQIPCKHAIGLMFAILSNKEFKLAQIPDDIAQKRDKIAKRQAKKEKAKAEAATNTKTPKKTNNAAKAKKIQKQLEGLSKAQLLINELLFHGLYTLNNKSVKSYKDIAKEFSSFHLTGVKNAFLALAYTIEKFKDTEIDHAQTIGILVQLNAMVKKSQQFLEQKLASQNYALEANELFEALGGVYKLEDLENLGLYQDNVSLVQLSFDISYDPIKREYIDRAFYIDLASGQISQSLNYRPIRALSRLKADDTCFKLIKAQRLYYYPGSINKRIRFNDISLYDVTAQNCEQIIKLAHDDLSQVIKDVKNEIKKTLAKKYVAVLLKYDKLALIDDELVLIDKEQKHIVLKDKQDDDNAPPYCVNKLSNIANSQLCSQQAMFGLIFYDNQNYKLYLQPLSLITNTQIIRLLY